MDIFGTSITVMHEIYNITIFIRGVIADVKAYGPTKREIQDKLEHEFLFLKAFKAIFFDEEAVMRDGYLHAALKNDVCNILNALRKALTEYGMLAAKHGLLGIEYHLPDQASDQSSSFSDRVKLRVKDLKRTIDWALFDKEKITKTLAEYSEWTGRLRQTMSLVLLTLSALGNSPLGDFAKSTRAKDMGLRHVIDRQILATSKPPDDFHGLSGRIVEGSELLHSSDMRTAEYEDDWGRLEAVVLEYRRYNRDLILATQFNLPNLDKVKEPVRNLAWILQNASFTDAHDNEFSAATNRLSIYALQCLGYIDQPEHHRTILLYQLPRSRTLPTDPKILTLHDWINASDSQGLSGMPKPSLGNRFFLAYALCLTLLNIHCSGWVHKNISSRVTVIFPSARVTTHSKSPCCTPYLMGWGLSRPITGGTDLTADTEVEPNFYRHPVRQGYPEAAFKVEHDIYAVGVVLLEIGLWKTVNHIFNVQIEKATKEGRLPPPGVIRDALVGKARTAIASEMGDSYARSVEKCLTGDFGVDNNDYNRTTLSAAFRSMVLDTIAVGMKL
ncbi:hypothetical protein BDW75DRAFT_134466 [Aspergillus navahoensis]